MKYFENKLIKAMNNIPGFMKIQELFCRCEYDEAFQKWFEQVKEENPKADTCKLYADCLDALESDLMVGGDLPWREKV